MIQMKIMNWIAKSQQERQSMKQRLLHFQSIIIYLVIQQKCDPAYQFIVDHYYQKYSMKRDPLLSTSQLEEDESYDEQNELTKVKIGKIPYGWYDQFKNFGYDNKLAPVLKEKKVNKLEEFIQKSENKDWWRTIRDQLNMRDIVLTDEQLALIDRIRSGKMASKTIANTQYKFQIPHDDPFPIHAHPPSKKNFMPSKWEQMKVNKILDGLLSGRIPWNPQEEENNQEQLFDAWASGTVTEKGVINIAPMKQKLPTHNQSYNPPKQYLLTQDQLKEWEQMDEEDRPFNFIPASYEKLRKIPFYDQLIQQRFQRCLDLYLCPRVKKRKLNIDPDSLIPKLPDPKLLKPFPTAISIIYEGHESPVLALAVSHSGEYFATGDQSGLLIIWQVSSSRKLLTQQYNDSIFSIDWSIGNIICFSHGSQVQILLWKYEKTTRSKGLQLLQQGLQKCQNKEWNWYKEQSEQYKKGFRVSLSFANDITHIQFQKSKGDYFLTVCPDNEKKNQVICIHRLSQSSSVKNFLKGGSIIRKVYFYPKKPQILILTNSKVVLFNLEKLEKIKQLSAGANTYACLSVHPEGGYIVVGSETQKLLCYDLDLSTKPYKTMQYHEKGITSTNFHEKYPLMASGSNDGSVHIFHFKVDNETVNDAVILPLKVLKGHTCKGVNGVKNIKFHPKQPWIFTVGSDRKVFLWM